MKAKSHTTETKSVQVKIGTGEHDLELKAKKAAERRRFRQDDRQRHAADRDW